MISRSGSEMSLVNIVHRLAFLLKCYFIIHHYYTYVNASSFGACVSVLVCFHRFNVSPFPTDEWHRGARKLCVFTCINKN